jgi:hypothetical protein
MTQPKDHKPNTTLAFKRGFHFRLILKRRSRSKCWLNTKSKFWTGAIRERAERIRVSWIGSPCQTLHNGVDILLVRQHQTPAPSSAMYFKQHRRTDKVMPVPQKLNLGGKSYLRYLHCCSIARRSCSDVLLRSNGSPAQTCHYL